MKALFIHRSVGQNFLDDAQVRKALSSTFFHDLNANTNIFTNEKGEVEGSSIVVQDGNTNPDGLAVFFQTALSHPQLNEILSSYDVIAFKSCYSANAMPTETSLDNSQNAYSGPIKEFIIQHPNTRFLILSPSPRRPLLTSKKSAQRAKAFASFLESYVGGFKNVLYFNLFELLSNKDGYLKKEYRRIIPFDQHPNVHGSRAAGKEFISYISPLRRMRD